MLSLPEKSNRIDYGLEPAWQGTKKALHTILLLAKIVIPVTFIIVALDKTGWLTSIAVFFSPFLKLLGLPGEAAMPLILGFFVNIYAAIGAIAVLPLTAREITVISLMILTCHALLMEAAVLRFTGLSPLKSTIIRAGTAFLFGYLLNLIYLVLGG